MSRRYLALNLIPMAMLLLGFAALAAPEPFRGPLVVARPLQPAWQLGSNLLTQPFYLADALGVFLLAGAVVTMWALAWLWEARCRTRN
jgi:hypothetical protein